ncbi:MAG: GNAT family N-acetyltransferase [Tabrizicola sp.]|uniref:GNAT family N-acetyltransferase n=1 Tax=Tabrizicola sp. TaxID=2005166 RepID=UPI002AB9D080|nr:GNAT family N-acetyltransferase [Tabrizicola sp.]MDZ4085720.1 GNAT family N-acetyltransferase [Tabrizicola sp.]
MPALKVELRDARPEDQSDFLRLWQGFCDSYDMTLPPEVTAFTWTRLMDPASPLTARLAVVDGTPQGFAIHQHHPSTWVLGDDGYLEDLFVAPKARGKGLGRALIEDLIAISRARGWRRLYWLTEIENATARHLYDQFCDNDGHIRYRMTL